MAKPEQLVINDLNRKLTKYAERMGLPLVIDKVPASMRGACGRPDLFVDLGFFHFRIEVKAKRSGKLSPLQERYFKKASENNDLMCHLVKGHEGVDLFMAGLDTLIDSVFEEYKRQERTWHDTQ